MNREPQRLILEAALIVFLGSSALRQDWADREYGIGIAGGQILPDQPPGNSLYQLSLTLYANPSDHSPKIAMLKSDSLTLVSSGETVSCYQRLLEYAYEEVGFPILEFSPDSSWIRVSLNCWDLENKTTAWLRPSSPRLKVLSWTEILSQADAFFFLRSEWTTFYSEPIGDKMIQVKLIYKDGVPDYHLYRKQIRGRWMQVELETPSSYCRTEREVLEMFGVTPTRRQVWIHYLDERDRPKIFYSTRGC